ncbi:MAG: DUF935 family protein [Ignavibacteriae bacterium]|nr:DUF935 family protein [Ignavibacteriota bacterium]
MELINKLKRSISDSLIKFAADKKPLSMNPAMDSKVVRHGGFRNVFSLYTEEFSGLTAYNIKHYFEAARKGLNFFKAALFEDIKRKDMQIGGVCQSRKLGITGRYKLNRIENFVHCNDEGMKAFVLENFSKINLPAFFSDVVDASVTGVSNFEIIYRTNGNSITIDKIQKIPNELIVYDEGGDRYLYLSPEERDIFKLRSLTASAYSGFDDRLDISKLSLIELPEEKVLEVHALDGNAGNGLMNGCIDALIWAFFFKSYLIKDLATFLELFAIPAIIGKYDPLMSREDRVKFDTAIRDFGNHFRMVMSKDAEVEFVTDTNKGSSNEIYHRTLEYWDKKIAIRILGQNLSTEVDSGSYAAAQAHSIIRNDFLISDMILCESAMNTLIKKVIDLNFSNPKVYPKFEFPETKSLEDKKMLSDIYSSLSSSGYHLDKEEVSKELGITTTPQSEIISKLRDLTKDHSRNGEMEKFLTDTLEETI